MSKRDVEQRMREQIQDIAIRIKALKRRAEGASGRDRVDAFAAIVDLEGRQTQLAARLAALDASGGKGLLADLAAEVQSEWSDIVQALEDWTTRLA